jgi:hypothetical protein
MSTAINTLYDPIRAFLGDFNTTVRKYSDAALGDVVRAVVRCGQVPGVVVAPDNLSLTPDLSTPKLYAQTVYQACLALLGPSIDSYSYRTRAMAESFGGSREAVFELKAKLYEMENGGADGFTGWTDFHSWAMSITGVNLWEILSELKTNAPVATVTVGRDGITVSE